MDERPIELPEGRPAIRVMMMPRETNAHGTIFGGIILSYIDQAGAVGAVEAGANRVVTVAMDKVEFHQPVYVGDLVSLFTEVERRGRTSLTMRVTVCAQRAKQPRDLVLVTEATVTYVNVDDQQRPAPLEAPRD
jgi:acyl-CoA thioesterase YciA